jgi:hypothetical protein
MTARRRVRRPHRAPADRESRVVCGARRGLARSSGAWVRELLLLQAFQMGDNILYLFQPNTNDLVSGCPGSAMLRGESCRHLSRHRSATWRSAVHRCARLRSMRTEIYRKDEIEMIQREGELDRGLAAKRAPDLAPPLMSCRCRHPAQAAKRRRVLAAASARVGEASVGNSEATRAHASRPAESPGSLCDLCDGRCTAAAYVFAIR